MSINYIYDAKIKQNPNLNNIVLDLDKTLIDHEYVCVNIHDNEDPLDYLCNYENYQIKKKKMIRLCCFEYEKNKLNIRNDVSTKNVNEHFSPKSYYIIYARKHLFSFLKSISQHYNLFTYTNATFSYAKFIINAIECITGEIFVGIIARKSPNHEVELKTLDFLYLKNRTIIIDDMIHAWETKYWNDLIHIRKYNHFPIINYTNDDDLLFLTNEFIKEKKFSSIIYNYSEYIKQAKNINVKILETIVPNGKWF